MTVSFYTGQEEEFNASWLPQFAKMEQKYLA